MIEFAFDLTGTLIFLSRAADFLTAARFVVASALLVTAFLMLFGAVGEVKRRMGALVVCYAIVCFGLFVLAAGDALGDKKYFASTAFAGAACAGIFAVLVTARALISLALKPLYEKERKYVAELNETPIARYGVCDKLYPLKGRSFGSGKDAFSLDYEEFRRFLQKIDDKDLSFSDRKEYNRITDRAGFLDGVALTEATVADFCEMFSDSVKLGAKYGVE